MRIRFGLCLLPVAALAACTTNGNQTKMTSAEPPGPPETFAMLPDNVAAVPYSRAEAPSRAVVAMSEPAGYVSSGSMQVPATSNNADVDRLISTYALNYEVPESLVRRVVKRESNFRPGARNGPYYGLMQILPATARGMGFGGPPAALLDAETNLKYAVKYLKGAYLVAGGDHDQAVRNYARGYYYDAKRKGLLEATGLKNRTRMPEGVMVASAGSAMPATPAQNVAAQWETGFVTATGSKASTLSAATGGVAAPMRASASARSGRILPAVASGTDIAAAGTSPTIDASAGMGFGPAGSVSTPSLGVSAE